MRFTSRTILLVLAFASSFLIAPSQTATPTTKPRARTATSAESAPAKPTPAAAAPCTCPPPAPVHVQPYTIKQETKHTQTLADGATITSVEQSVSARDAQGRTYRDSIRSLNGDIVHNLQIYDFPAGTRYTWNVGPNYPQVVNVYSVRPAQPQIQQQPAAQPPARRYYPYRRGSLPPQTIAGVYAEGYRYTRTTPAGYDGNDRDLVNTSEYWTSPDLGIQLRQITDDPRNGKSTMETTEVQRSADPALFQPPSWPQNHASDSAVSTASAPCNCAPTLLQRHLPPYSAKQETTQVQTLPDGTNITHTTETLLWRDTDGRTRTETVRSQSNGTQMRFLNIYDPVAGIRMTWTVGGPSTTPKVVSVYSTQPVSQPAPVAAPASQPARRYYPYVQESLPPTTIDSLYVEGYRDTRTTPAGTDGNDHDITSTSEYWNSPDLGLVLRRVSDDPRTGKSTTETTDIRRDNPDPAFFKAPAGYQVKNASP